MNLFSFSFSVRPIHHRRDGQPRCLIYIHFLPSIRTLHGVVRTPFHDKNTTLFATFDLSLAHTNMATFTKRPSGSWRTQVRCKGKYASETFLLGGDAENLGTRNRAPDRSRRTYTL
jgi:hypothetical protein